MFSPRVRQQPLYKRALETILGDHRHRQTEFVPALQNITTDSKIKHRTRLSMHRVQLHVRCTCKVGIIEQWNVIEISNERVLHFKFLLHCVSNSTWRHAKMLELRRITFLRHITKTCLFKYTENFTTKKWNISDKKSDIFFIFLLKT